jgi:D-alanyl-D-alanine carboxypeptidase (penicillin-binding protein 5/6)
LDIVAKEGVQDIFRKDDIYKIEKTIEWYYTDENNQLLLEAPIMKNQLIGKVIYKLNNQVVAEMDLIAARDIMKKKTIMDIITPGNNSKEQQGNNENTQLYYLAGAAGVVILLLFALIFTSRRKKARRYGYYRRYR